MARHSKGSPIISQLRPHPKHLMKTASSCLCRAHPRMIDRMFRSITSMAGVDDPPWAEYMRRIEGMWVS